MPVQHHCLGNSSVLLGTETERTLYSGAGISWPLSQEVRYGTEAGLRSQERWPVAVSHISAPCSYARRFVVSLRACLRDLLLFL